MVGFPGNSSLSSNWYKFCGEQFGSIEQSWHFPLCSKLCFCPSMLCSAEPNPYLLGQCKTKMLDYSKKISKESQQGALLRVGPSELVQMNRPWSWPGFSVSQGAGFCTFSPAFFAILILIRFSQLWVLGGWAGQPEGSQEGGFRIPLSFWSQRQWGILWFQPLQ